MWVDPRAGRRKFGDWAETVLSARLHTIQGRLGHASIVTTLDRYGHLMAGLDEAAAEALPSPIAPVLPQPVSHIH